MSTSKPKVATKARLLESIEHLQKELNRIAELEMKERQARIIAEAKIRELENQTKFAAAVQQTTEQEMRKNEALAFAEKARADAFELVLRLRYRAEKPIAPADCRSLKDPVDGYVGPGVFGRP